jgi:hypothetical protein
MPTFHVVASSLPNCSFSQRTSKPGFVKLQYAEVCHKLMLQLGYEKYGTSKSYPPWLYSNPSAVVTQGGDWGYRITRAIGMRYPIHVLPALSISY